MKVASEILAEVVSRSHTKLFAIPQVDAALEAATDPICEQDPYPRYPPGKCEAQCTGATIYKDPQFHCWKVQLAFRIVPDGGCILKFFHMGEGEKPKAGPRSEYLRAWIIANGAPPRRRQELSRRIFLDKIFEVVVGDVRKRHDGREHPECAIYSVVKEILKRVYP